MSLNYDLSTLTLKLCVREMKHPLSPKDLMYPNTTDYSLSADGPTASILALKSPFFSLSL